MSSSIAGAIITGQVADRYTASNKLSHWALTILAKVLQLAGAITITSAQRPSITWLAHEFSSKSSAYTLFFDNVEKVKGVIKSRAEGVRITFTSAPDLTSSRSNSTAL